MASYWPKITTFLTPFITLLLEFPDEPYLVKTRIVGQSNNYGKDFVILACVVLSVRRTDKRIE